MPKKQQFSIFAYGASGEGISGGDRIFIELAKRIAKDARVVINVSDEGERMCKRNGLSSKLCTFATIKLSHYRNFSFPIFYLSLIVQGVLTGLTVTLSKKGENVILYSASEFLMDALPAFLVKLRYPKAKWVAAWYQTAPSPLKGFTITKGETRHRLRALPYFIFQKISKPFIAKYADYICVNNESEKKYFPFHEKKNSLFVMYGAIDTEKIKKYIKTHKNISKKYEAVFQGRFHPQKGVEELIDIWKLVVDSKKNAKLVMIGDGPLMDSVKEKITNNNLARNIILKGFVFDGDEKYKLFSQSRLVVHPSLYDSGGMASAEAMAFGLPVVGYNMPSYKDYYSKGMAKVTLGNKGRFAKKIVEFIEKKSGYDKVAKEARYSAFNNWSWNKRVKEFVDFIN